MPPTGSSAPMAPMLPMPLPFVPMWTPQQQIDGALKQALIDTSIYSHSLLLYEYLQLYNLKCPIINLNPRCNSGIVEYECAQGHMEQSYLSHKG